LFIQNRLSQNPIDFAKKFIDYKISYSSLPGREGFRLHIKNADKKPYIPATEIKGAIRTSLLYTMLSDKTYYEILKKSLEKKELNTIASEIQRKFFRGKENDAKYDLFKFIKISDTNSISTNHLKIVNVAVLGSSRNIKIWLETINPKNEFDFSLVIHENKYLEELGLEILKGYLSIDKLLYACYHRSKEILEEEERFFTGHNKILDVINKLKKANLPDSPLLRLGAGQGFLGTTIGLKVKKNDPSLYDEVLRAGISSLRRWKTQRNNFPKTRRVLIDDKGLAIDILGWVKLIP
jgi:CRISPR type III-A-associated RAMP protein Csm5